MSEEIRFHLITNQPRRACLTVLGCWPAPSWVRVVTTAEAVAALDFDTTAFALLYGEDVMRTDRGKFFYDRPRSDLALALDAHRERRARAGGKPFGLTAEEFDRLSAWKARRQLPGVLPAFPEGLKDAVMVSMGARA